MKVNQTINDALIHLGVIDATENPTAEDTSFALRALNRILDGYNTQNLTIPYTKHTVYPNTSWTSSQVEIGTIKEIDAPMPQSIDQLSFRDDTPDGIDYNCTKMTQTEYEQITYKGVVAIPSKYFYHQTEAGVVTIYLNAIPQSGLKMVIYGKEPFSTSLKVTDDVEWGTGVEKMLMYRLSVELASSYHIEPSQLLLLSTADAESIVKSYNFQPRTLRLNSTFRGYRQARYNPARI